MFREELFLLITLPDNVQGQKWPKWRLSDLQMAAISFKNGGY
jgi:hypothetical protein